MYIVFVSWKIEVYNHNPILPLLLVSEWPYWPLNSKRLAFFNKWINAILHKMLNLGFQYFPPLFLRSALLLVATLSLYLCYLFELIFALLKLGDKGIRVLTGPFLSSNIMWFVQNFQWVQNSIFPNGKI